jgi:hydrogenase maturation protein HypF
MAVSYLTHDFGRDFLKLNVPFVRDFNPARAEFVVRMVERGVHSPLTSSCGRLFDAVAALIGICDRVSYEAQAAIELEAVIDGKNDDCKYPFEVKPGRTSWIIGTRPLFEAILEDLRRNVSAGVISRRFHDGLAEVLVGAAERIRGQTFLDRVCLSGGVFNNVYLLRSLKNSLEAAGFQVFIHSQVPAGDGGLSLGQALIAAHRLSRH